MAAVAVFGTETSHLFDASAHCHGGGTHWATTAYGARWVRLVPRSNVCPTREDNGWALAGGAWALGGPKGGAKGGKGRQRGGQSFCFIASAFAPVAPSPSSSLSLSYVFGPPILVATSATMAPHYRVLSTSGLLIEASVPVHPRPLGKAPLILLCDAMSSVAGDFVAPSYLPLSDPAALLAPRGCLRQSLPSVPSAPSKKRDLPDCRRHLPLDLPGELVSSILTLPRCLTNNSFFHLAPPAKRRPFSAIVPPRIFMLRGVFLFKRTSLQISRWSLRVANRFGTKDGKTSLSGTRRRIWGVCQAPVSVADISSCTNELVLIWACFSEFPDPSPFPLIAVTF